MRLRRRFRGSFKKSLVGGLLLVGTAEIALRALVYFFMNIYGLHNDFLQDDSFKMLFVGDSFTAGGSSESGFGYSHYMQEAIERNRLLGDREVEVINIALSGTDTSIHRQRLDRFLDLHPRKPDLVFVVTGVNNRTTQQMRAPYVRDPLNRDRVNPCNRLMYGSMLLSFLGGVVGSCSDTHFPLKSLEEDFREDSFHGYIRASFQWELDSMLRRAERENVSVVLGTYIRPSETALEDLVILQQAAQMYGVPLLDIYSEELDREFVEKGFYTKDKWHPNDRGQRAVAGVYLKRMFEQGLLPETPTELQEKCAED